LLFGEALRFFLFFHEVTTSLLFSETFNFLFFLKFLAAGFILESDLLLVSLDEFLLHLLGALLSGKLTLLLTLEIFFSLAFDEFSLEHFFLEALNIIQFKFFELVRNGLGVRNLILILNLKFGLHLLIVLLHLVLLHFTPVVVDFFLNHSLSVLESLLGLLLVVHVTHHHLRLKGFNLVLSVVHVPVSLSQLLITESVLVVGLISINAASLNLFVLESSNTVVLTLLSDGIKGIGPFANTVLRGHLQVLSLHGLMLVGRGVGSEGALGANPLKVINRDDGGALLLSRLIVTGSGFESTWRDGVLVGRHGLHSSS